MLTLIRPHDRRLRLATRSALQLLLAFCLLVHIQVSCSPARYYNNNNNNNNNKHDNNNHHHHHNHNRHVHRHQDIGQQRAPHTYARAAKAFGAATDGDGPSSRRRLHGRAVYVAYEQSRVNSSESLGSAWLYQQDQPPILDQCCACDEAKYELVFEGLWSKYTHPDDFPENYWLAHFSDIIGASHSNDFRMWSQDSLASDGVRELAETGATKKLESELKQVSSKTRTIIKARELRYPTLNSKTSAVFRTDKHHHLVSVLSKLGPSPDWMVGVSSLELCQIDCTWAPQRVVNLYLWDAGTDSGTSFVASDSPTRPQERIHPYRRASSSLGANSLSTARLMDQQAHDGGGSGGGGVYGDFRQSAAELLPIVDDTPPSQHQLAAGPTASSSPMQDHVKPFARLTITRQRIYEKSCTSGNQLEPPVATYTRPSSYNLITQHQHQHHQQGQQQQQPSGHSQGQLHFDHLHPSLLSSDTLVEPVRPPSYSDCRFTDWSDWSSCSSTCGKGIRTRTRSFYDDQAHLTAGCSQADLIEKEICLADCLGNASCVTHDWSEWSKCSVGCGPGYRKRTRSPIGPLKAACASIELAEVEPCTGSCGGPTGAGPDQAAPSHCAVTDWSQWSECSVACGRGTKIRTRQFILKEDLENCANVKLLQKQSCTGRPELCKQAATKGPLARERICMLPADAGLCRGFIKRWFYDEASAKCKRFIYGGCRGNENNFHTFQDCRRACILSPDAE